MVIDAHAHIEGAAVEASKKLIMQAVEHYEIERVYISALEGYTPTEEVVDRINGATAQFMKEQPRHIGGYVYVSPEHKNALDVVRLKMMVWRESSCGYPHTVMTRMCIG